MNINKHILLILLAVISFSCSDYSKILNKGTAEQKYKMATTNYENQEYKKALGLFEACYLNYKGKPQQERIDYMMATSHYNEEDFLLSAYYYEKFVTSYPKSTKREEAMFLLAKSHSLNSLKYNLDQEDTVKAIGYFQEFINKYPDSDKMDESNKIVSELQDKIERKALEIGKLYYKLSRYKASIVSLDNMILDYLGTKYKEEALYFRLKSSYELGIRSVFVKKEERIKRALDSYKKLLKNFPSTIYLKEANEMKNKLEEESSKIKTS